VPDATFATPDVTTFCRLDELGLVVVGQHLQPDRAVLACRVADDAVEEADRWCRRCGCEGRPRDTVTRRLAHEPLGWRPTTPESGPPQLKTTASVQIGYKTPYALADNYGHRQTVIMHVGRPPDP